MQLHNSTFSNSYLNMKPQLTIEFLLLLTLISAHLQFISSSSCCPLQPPCKCLPNMRLIDCSGQNLTTNPKHDHDCSLSQYSFLSLRINRIRCLDLKQLGGLTIDLRQNPLKCSCISRPPGNVTIRSHCLAPTRSVTLYSTTSALLPSLVIPSSSSSHYTHLSLSFINSAPKNTTIFSLIKPTSSSMLNLLQTSVIIISKRASNEGKNDLKWIIQTSAAVPASFFVIGIVIVLYRVINKYCKNRETVNINTFAETLDMESNDDMVIYSRENNIAEIEVLKSQQY